MIRYDLRRLLPRSAIVALCLVCLGAFHSPVSASVWPGTASGGTTTFGGTTVGPGNVAVITFSNTPSGPVYATAGGKVYLPGGKVMDVTGKAPISPAAYSKAIGRAASRFLPGVAGVAAIYDLLDDLGYTRDESGFKQNVTTNNFTYSCVYGGASPEGCVASWQSNMRGVGYPSCTVTGWNWGGTAYFQGQPYAAIMVITTSACPNSSSPGSRTLVGTTRGLQPRTQQDLEDLIASKSGWPSGSKIGDAIREAIGQGETLPIPAPTEVTGPSTLPGTSTTTQTTVRDAQGNPTGVTNVTTSTTYNFNYGPNTVTTTTVTTTITTNPDGTTQTATDKKEGEEKPRDPCADSPDLVTCGKLDDPKTEVPKTTKTLTYAPEELGLGAGACPAAIPLNTSRGNWSLDLTPYCNATTTYVRPMVILVAMFLAYLIMTGHRFGGD